MSKNPKLFSLLILVFIKQLIGADFFTRLCLRPLQSGKAKLTDSTTCVLKLNITTNSNAALKLCRAVSPFTVIKVTEGYPTECVYDKAFYCHPHEEEFLGYCFLVKSHGRRYHRKACGRERYKLHVIQSLEEIKWVAAVFGERHKEVWVGNIGETAVHLRPVRDRRPMFEGYEANAASSPVKLRLEKGGLDGIRIGTAIYGDRREFNSFLCSRQANLYIESMETDKEEGTIYEQLHIPHLYVPEKNGYVRPYVYYGLVHAVEGSEFNADVVKLNRFCDLLPHGYAVRVEDFENLTEFRNLVGQFTEMPVRVSARRDPNNKNQASGDCKKHETNPQAYAELFSHVDKGGKTLKFPYDLWADGYPKNMCADKPRTTVAVWKNGYVDVPAMARLPVICAYGQYRRKVTAKPSTTTTTSTTTTSTTTIAQTTTTTTTPTTTTTIKIPVVTTTPTATTTTTTSPTSTLTTTSESDSSKAVVPSSTTTSAATTTTSTVPSTTTTSTTPTTSTTTSTTTP
uniref:US6 n=1 Tax=Haemonchus contortus TaxID=6289 RepID=A0A7I4Y0P7_HAECO